MNVANLRTSRGMYLSLAVVLMLGPVHDAACSEAPKVRVIANVAYGNEAPDAQMLSAFLVESPQPSPVLVQILSGGWSSSPPRDANPEPFRPYLDAGFSVVVVAHRTVDEAVHWPAPADDVARAVQYIRVHAKEWGVDPKRIAIKGRSSGGHVALMVGLGPERAQPAGADPIARESSRPTCILAGSPPTDLVLHMRELLGGPDRQEYLWGRMCCLLGVGQEDLTLEQLLQRLKPLSPIEYVTKDSPPVFLMSQGPADAFWPGDARLKWEAHTPITCLILANRLKELGVPHEVCILPAEGARGTASPFTSRELAFLRQYLNLPASVPAATPPAHPKRDATEPPGTAEPAAASASSRIVLKPQAGAMQVTARVPNLDNQAFALGIPETIGCREAMLVNFPEAKVEWQGPDADGTVSCSWGPGGRISYSLRLVPASDYVDVEMTVRNHTDFSWRDVFAFNCVNPTNAPAFQDWKLQRTYMSVEGKPHCMAQTTRVKGSMPTVGFYLPARVAPGDESVFVRGFGATSPDRTDGEWIVTTSEPAGAYMAATALEAAFLFDNLDRCCLHAAPSFGDIGPGEASTTVSRIYLAKGTLESFLQRLANDRPGLAARQKWARPAGMARGTKPHGRMEEMSPDELEQVLAEAPIAFVPLGTYEHHGFHLPVCFDGIKAHALCERVAVRTGGTVLPTFFYGTGGGHVGYKWTLMLPESQISPLIEATLDHLARQGFRVVVLLTGHYPTEQVDMVHRLAQEAQNRHPHVRFIGLTEPEITTPAPGDASGGDHAAKYETSIALALNPAWVHLDRLTAGRDPARVVLADTPRKDVPTHDPTHPLYAIYGQDPREKASQDLGDKVVQEIVSRLAERVTAALPNTR